MLPKVKEAFLMEKAYQEDCGIKSNAVVDGFRDFIFVNRFGNVQHQGTLNKALYRIIRDCNYEILDNNHKEDVVILPKFSNHSLRHTFTTRMCEAGVNIKAMQDILGHADAETTMDIYAEATKDLKKSELINFEEYFARQKKSQARKSWCDWYGKMNLDNMNIDEMDMEIPSFLLSHLIEWMRNKGISDEDIVDCMLYICKEKWFATLRPICDWFATTYKDLGRFINWEHKGNIEK